MSVSNQRTPVTGYISRHGIWIILALGLTVALWLRLMMFNAESVDLTFYVYKWYDRIRELGGFPALRENLGNYTPPYLYLLTLATYLAEWIPRLYAIKLISIAFDFICGYLVYKIVRLRYPRGLAPLAALLVVIFAPTVVLNSAYWGQVDAAYTAALLACLYFLLKKHNALAFSAFGLALAFKLQAIFLAPVLIVLCLKRQVAWKNLLLIPLIYFISIVPAWLLGRPLDDLLTIYLRITDSHKDLTLHAPNLYQWFPTDKAVRTPLTVLALILAVLAVLLLIVVTWRIRVLITGGSLIELALVSALLVPYFLPRMHERYFFVADVIAIVFAFYYPRFFFVPIGIGLVSLFAYTPFLFNQIIVPLPILAFVELVLLIVVATHFFWSLLQQRQALIAIAAPQTG
jgi:Gpi18-like mannosyltransferase